MSISRQIARKKYLADRSERNQRSYQGKIERGECGHCSEPLAPNSKSCCPRHLEYFREKERQARDRRAPGTTIAALAAWTSTFPQPADVRRPAQRPIKCIPRSALECLPPSFPKYIALKPELDSCWHWTGPTVINPRYKDRREGQEYGIWVQYLGRKNGRTIRKAYAAHKFTYQTLVGPVLAGMELDHLCDNKLCVNPEHLEPVTHQVNVIRGFLRRSL